MPYYAELDGNGICKAVTQTHSEIIEDTMIEIVSFDMALLGQKYEADVWSIQEIQTPITVNPLDELRAKVDLLLTERIKAGGITATDIQVSALPEAAKTELSAEAEKIEAAAAELVKA